MGLILQGDLLLIEGGSLGLLEMHGLDEVLDDMHVLVEQVKQDLLCEEVFDVGVHLRAEEVLQYFEKHRD